MRRLQYGSVIPSREYADQPYVVVLPDGVWLCTMTTCSGEEGEVGQHIVALRSEDQGKSWSAPVAIEPPTGPEASWVVPLLVPANGAVPGRVYAFYVYNRDNMREVISDSGPCPRVDTLGYYTFKFSDDGGRSWSGQRYEIPVREFDIDTGNPYDGQVRFFWSVCKPHLSGGKAYLAVHKVGHFGEGFMASSEGAVLVSDNLLQVTDPHEANWLTLPEGTVGLRSPLGPVADEHNITTLSDGSLFCTYRTTDGHPCHAYSRDGGRNWTPPAHMTYGPGGRKVKHPRAANFVRKFSNGRFLYWFHNHGLNGYAGRNPVWVLGGQEVESPHGRCIKWSEPELLLYDDNESTRISYPDFVEQNGQLFATETQKSVARVHPLAPTLLQAVWEWPTTGLGQPEGVLAQGKGVGSLTMPLMPFITEGNGFSLCFWVKFLDLEPDQIILDTTDANGVGLLLALTKGGVLSLTLTATVAPEGTLPQVLSTQFCCDGGVLRADNWHKVSLIVEGGPRLVLWVIDEKLNDGGVERAFGWGRVGPELHDINGASEALVGPSLRGELGLVWVVGRALLVNEAAAWQRNWELG